MLRFHVNTHPFPINIAFSLTHAGFIAVMSKNWHCRPSYAYEKLSFPPKSSSMDAPNPLYREKCNKNFLSFPKKKSSIEKKNLFVAAPQSSFTTVDNFATVVLISRFNWAWNTKKNKMMTTVGNVQPAAIPLIFPQLFCCCCSTHSLQLLLFIGVIARSSGFAEHYWTNELTGVNRINSFGPDPLW